MKERTQILNAFWANKAAAALVVVVFSLLALGVVMLSSTSSYSNDRHVQISLGKQLQWIAIGMVMLLAGVLIDHRLLRKVAAPLLLFSFVLLLLVYVPNMGLRINGARRWFQIPPFRFQPSEFAKFGIVLFLAHFLAIQIRQKKIQSLDLGFLWPGAALAGICALVVIEPDFGTTALIATVGVIMMFAAGTRWFYLAPAMIGGACLLAFMVSRNPERMNRLMAFADLAEHKDGAGYQLNQSLLALGSGGVSGVGLGKSSQKLGFLPEAHTDFILAITGEELGLIGTLSVWLAFLLLFACGLWISFKAPDIFGFLLALGITMMLTIQAAINMGVVTGALPTKGLSLPFISAGGSNLCVTLFEIGVLLNIYRNSSDELKEEELMAGQAVPAGV